MHYRPKMRMCKNLHQDGNQQITTYSMRPKALENQNLNNFEPITLEKGSCCQPPSPPPQARLNFEKKNQNYFQTAKGDNLLISKSTDSQIDVKIQY